MGQGRSPVEVGRQQPGIGVGIVIGVGHNLDRSLAQWDGGHIVGTVSQQQFQPRMQITQDFIFDKLICYSYVQEYVIE